MKLATCALCGSEPISLEHLEESHLKHGEVPGKGEAWMWKCPICEGKGRPNEKGGAFDPTSAAAGLLLHIDQNHGHTGVF